MSGGNGGGGSPNNSEWRFNQTLRNVQGSVSPLLYQNFPTIFFFWICAVDGLIMI
jgi:hypothetical protein